VKKQTLLPSSNIAKYYCQDCMATTNIKVIHNQYHNLLNAFSQRLLLTLTATQPRL